MAAVRCWKVVESVCAPVDACNDDDDDDDDTDDDDDDDTDDGDCVV